MNAQSNTRRSPIQLLRGYLEERGFGPNEQLPPERQLAEELNITRSRLRTSLAKLERDGVIWRHVGQGTFMSPLAGSTGPARPGDGRDVLETNPSEILEARLALEPQIAYLAAQRATGSEVDEMEKILKEAGSHISWYEWSLLDKTFHVTLAKASKNQLLLNLLLTIQESQTLRNWGRLSDAPAAVVRRDHVAEEHHAIIEAIKSREAHTAAMLMRRHLEAVRDALLGPFGPALDMPKAAPVRKTDSGTKAG